jgi:hypothetical protein
MDHAHGIITQFTIVLAIAIVALRVTGSTRPRERQSRRTADCPA